jgi:VCBS repeat-containing protein
VTGDPFLQTQVPTNHPIYHNVSSGLITPQDGTVDWLNAVNAPRWFNFVDFQRTHGGYNANNSPVSYYLKYDNIPEFFGSSWVVEMTDQVLSQQSLRTDTMEKRVTALTGPFSDSIPTHQTHFSGMNVDVAFFPGVNNANVTSPVDVNTIQSDTAPAHNTIGYWVNNPQNTDLTLEEQKIVQDIYNFYRVSGGAAGSSQFQGMFKQVFAGVDDTTGPALDNVHAVLDFLLGSGGTIHEPQVPHRTHFHITFGPPTLVPPPAIPQSTNQAAAEGSNNTQAAVNLLAAELMLQTALSDWSNASAQAAVKFSSMPPALQILSDIGASTLAETQLFGREISLSESAAGYGWFIDPSPSSNEAFLPTSDPNVLIAPPGSPAYAKIDLLTVELHELGHVLGLGEAPASATNDLMSQYLPSGMRRLLSPLDLQMLAAIESGAPETGWILKQDASPTLNLMVTNTDIINGDFSVSDSTAANFGWTLLGGAAVENGQLNLDESASSATRAYEDFVVPTGATSLSFSLTGLNFVSNGSGPPDAFEMALLGNNEQSAVGTISLSNTDAAFNAQADGSVLTSPKVHVLGANTIGNGPVTVSVDLTGVEAGTPLRLYFDLIGAGPLGSEVKVSNLQLHTGVTSLPPAASDVAGAVLELGPAVTVSASYTDPNVGDTPSFSIDTTTDATKGKVTNNGDGTFTYDPNGAFIGLAAGQTGTDKFLYTVTTAAGLSSTATVTITVTGQNEPPVITGGTTTGAVTELPVVSTATDTATGSLAFTDSDLTDTHTVSVTPHGSGGSNYLGTLLAAVAADSASGATGQVNWTYQVSDSALEILSGGQTLTQAYDVTIDDGHGGTATQTIAITLTGTNHAPVITGGTASGAITELPIVSAVTDTATGALSFTDVDQPDIHIVSAAPHGSGLGYIGTLQALVGTDSTGGATGQVNWTYQVSDTALEILSGGQSKVQTYDVTIDDGHGGTATQTITITLTGTNHAPGFTGGIIGEGITELPTVSAVTDTATGALTFTDVDQPDTHTVSVAPHGSGTGYIGALRALIGTDSTGGATGQVNWTYQVTDTALEILSGGQSKVQTYDVTVDDGHGGTATQTITVTLTGTNHAPVITGGTTSGAVTELPIVSAGTDTATGALSFTDVDLPDTHTVSVAPHGSGTGYIGTLQALVGADSTGGATGQVNWTYQVTDTALEILSGGQSKVQTYDVTVDDGHGGTATQTITITLTGTNHPPAITGGMTSGVITELPVVSSTIDSATGLLSFTDVDQPDTHTVSVAPHGTGTGYIGTLQALVGTDSTGGATGQVNWTYQVADTALEILSGGQTLTQAYDVTVDDGYGGTATQTITITLTGTNHAPVITGGTTSGAITELPTVSAVTDTATGALTFTDVDQPDTHTVSIAPHGSGTGYIGALQALVGTDSTGGATGQVNWTYQVTDTALEILSGGQSKAQTYDVTVDDGHGGKAVQTLTVTLTGTNHAPVITGRTTSGAVTDTATGALTFTDVDQPDTHTVSVAPHGSGTGYIGALQALVGTDSTGGATGQVNWTYQVTDTALEILSGGQSKVQTYDVTVNDGHGGTATQTITITLTGTNHAPVFIGGIIGGGITELPIVSAVTDTATGSLSFTDVDQPDTHTVSVAPHGSAAGYIGALQALVGTDSTGGATGQVNWTYQVTDTALEILSGGQSKVQTYDVTVNDGHGGTATQTITVTLTGTNHAPVVTGGTTSGAITELPTVSAVTDTTTGSLSFTDVDQPDTHIVSIAPHGSGSGYIGTIQALLGADSTGGATGQVKWTYQVTDTALEILSGGQSKVQTYDVTVADGHGGTATQTVMITLAGTNHAPVITGGKTSGAITELPTVSAVTDTTTGSLSFTDVDRPDTHTVSVAPHGSGAGYLGTLKALVATDSTGSATGQLNWTYQVADTALEIIPIGQSKVQTYDVTVNDGHGGTAIQTVTITLTGNNLTPAITGAHGFSLGDAANYGLIGFGGNNFHTANNSITDSIGVGNFLAVQLAGSVVHGNLVSTGPAYLSPGGTVTGAIIGNNAALSVDIAGLKSLSAAAAAETGTKLAVNGGTINVNTGTLDASGNYVFTVTSWNYGSGVTINGDGTHGVIFNIPATIQPGLGAITLTGGITSDQVLFNDLSSSQFQATQQNITTNGTWLAPNAPIVINVITIAGHLYGGQPGANFQFVGNTLISLPAAPQTVTSVVASPANGEVTTGNTVIITLDTSQSLTVAGTPVLLLNDGGTAAYDPVHSTPRALVFDYTVASGQVTTDLVVSGIELPSRSAITDLTGNSVNLSGAGVNLGLQVNTKNTGSVGPSGGSFTITGSSVFEEFGASTANVTFAPGDTGIFKLDASSAFAGSATGLALGNYLDLADIVYEGTTTIGYTPNKNNTGGSLTVSDGMHTANIALLGQYTVASFTMVGDGHGGTLLTDPPVAPTGLAGTKAPGVSTTAAAAATSSANSGSQPTSSSGSTSTVGTTSPSSTVVPSFSTSSNVTFTSSGGVTSVAFGLSYDPELVTLAGAEPGADLPKGAKLAFTTVQDGEARIEITSSDPLPAGAIELASLKLDGAADDAGQAGLLGVRVDEVNGGLSAALPPTTPVKIRLPHANTEAAPPSERVADSGWNEQSLDLPAPSPAARIRLPIQTDPGVDADPTELEGQSTDSVETASVPINGIRIPIPEDASSPGVEPLTLEIAGAWNPQFNKTLVGDSAQGHIRIPLMAVAKMATVQHPDR